MFRRICLSLLILEAFMGASHLSYAIQFENTVIINNLQIPNTDFHEITFNKKDGGNFEDFEPGDLIVLRKSKWSFQAHDAHVYALSYFNKTGSIFKILIDPRYRFNEKSLPQMAQPLSAQLSQAKNGDATYKIKVLKARMRPDFFSGPLTLIGFGGAVTRQLGILRYMDENFENLEIKHPVWFVHSLSQKKNHFLSEEFKKMESGNLMGFFKYIPYQTSSGSVPHIQDSIFGTPSYISRFLTRFSSFVEGAPPVSSIDSGQNLKNWNMLVTAPDARHNANSKIEVEIENQTISRHQSGLPAPTPDHFYRSNWDKTSLVW